MPKVDWKQVWQLSFTSAFAILSGVIVIVVSKLDTAWIILVFSIPLYFVLLGMVQLIWVNSEKGIGKIKQWLLKPKIRHYFYMSNPNDLKLYIQNPKGAKDTHVECTYGGYKDIRGRPYSDENRNKLKLAENASSGNPPFFIATLTSNDTREINVGIPFRNQIALYVGDAHVFGYVDGRFEYIIKCRINYKNARAFEESISIWLTIKDGVLIAINDEL